MKYLENIEAVAALKPDYLGFIFYEKSKRNFDGIVPKLPKSIKKVGVFVNATMDEVVEIIKNFDLQAVQLHGDESVAFCQELRSHFQQSEKSHDEMLNQVQHTIEIIKVFSVGTSFDFEQLKPFEDYVDYFLFDTKGKERGGNGIQFDWRLLEKYPLEKPYFLSGGIGLQNTDSILSFLRKQESNYCYALDVNSKFESIPGVKKIEALEKFKYSVTTNRVK